MATVCCQDRFVRLNDFKKNWMQKNDWFFSLLKANLILNGSKAKKIKSNQIEFVSYFFVRSIYKMGGWVRQLHAKWIQMAALFALRWNGEKKMTKQISKKCVAQCVNERYIYLFFQICLFLHVKHTHNKRFASKFKITKKKIAKKQFSALITIPNGV